MSGAFDYDLLRLAGWALAGAWYFAWTLGFGFACLAAIVTALWLETTGALDAADDGDPQSP